MCYSAQVWAEYRNYVRVFGADISIKDFVRLFGIRGQGEKIKIPKAMEAAFYDPQTPEERQIKALIDEYTAKEITATEQELFKQKKRLADAERALASKTTKAASESKRIATDKISRSLTRLDDLRRTELKDRDSRIFPGYYAPVIIVENGQRVIKPMRYQCRPAGKPAFYDTKYPGTYNARRDSLQGFWKGLFGVSHGIMVVNVFYENVARTNSDGTTRNEVLEFKPNPRQDMLIACLWSHWEQGGESLDSFAAITDEPPPEVAAAGHDRCIVPIKSESVDAWLNPDKHNLAALYAILDDRERPYYEHRLAA